MLGRSERVKGGQDPPGKSQVVIGFLKNSGMEPLREASQRRSVQLSVKYVNH